ncbi:MAG: hypothetical protein ACRD1Z_00705, partial [Vicinamibacteria bacterium]
SAQVSANTSKLARGDRKTLQVKYPLVGKKSPAGEVNLAAMQLDFYIRSPETDDRNNPPRVEVDWPPARGAG